MNQFRSSISKYFFSKIDLNKFKIPQNVPVETSYLTDVDVNTLDRIKHFKTFTKKFQLLLMVNHMKVNPECKFVLMIMK